MRLLTNTKSQGTTGHSIEHVPPSRHTEIGTVSLPATSEHGACV